MRTRKTTRVSVIRRALLATAVCLGFAAPAEAFQLEFEEDSELSGNIDVTLGYAASFRAEDADRAGWTDPVNPAPNVASDSRVPDAGDRITNVFKTTIEVGLAWRNYGFVSSLAYQYDTEIMRADQADIGLANGSAWTSQTKKYAGNVSDVLDAYVYGSFEVGENQSPLDVRAGKQVINWGEGLFFLDGVSVQVPLNINKLVTPGSELKEAYIGVSALYAQLGIGDVSSLEAYVQTDWRRTEFPPHGTFYGDDAFFRGGTETGLRDVDIEADEYGQWGAAFRTLVGDGTEIGFYYSHYHETFPFVQVTIPGSASDVGGALGLQQVWPEDLDMLGASFATTLGTWSFNGELAYRPDRPLFTGLGTLTAPGDRNIEEHDTLTGSVHGIWLGGEFPLGIDSQTVLAQFGFDYVDGNLDNLAPQSSITKGVEKVDDLAYGLAAEWTGTWRAVRPGTDLSLSLFLQRDLQGNSHFWGNFAEGRWLGTLTLTANIGNEWEAKAGYTWVDQDNSHFETQDVINLSLNYKF